MCGLFIDEKGNFQSGGNFPAQPTAQEQAAKIAADIQLKADLMAANPGNFVSGGTLGPGQAGYADFLRATLIKGEATAQTSSAERIAASTPGIVDAGVSAKAAAANSSSTQAPRNIFQLGTPVPFAQAGDQAAGLQAAVNRGSEITVWNPSPAAIPAPEVQKNAFQIGTPTPFAQPGDRAVGLPAAAATGANIMLYNPAPLQEPPIKLAGVPGIFVNSIAEAQKAEPLPPVDQANTIFQGIPVLAQANQLGASIGKPSLSNFVNKLESLPFVGGTFEGIVKAGEAVRLKTIAEQQPTNQNIEAYQKAAGILTPGGRGTLPSTPIDNLVKNAVPWYEENIQSPFNKFVSPISDKPFLNIITSGAKGFVAVPPDLLSFGTQVASGTPTLAKNLPSVIPLAVAGLAMQTEGAYRGITTDPAKFIAEQLGFAVALSGGQEGITYGVGFAKTAGKEYIPIEKIGYSPSKGYPVGSGQTELTLKESFSRGTLLPEPTSMKSGTSEMVPYVPDSSHLPGIGESASMYQSFTAWERGIGIFPSIKGEYSVPSLHSELNAMYSAPVAETYFTKFGTSQVKDLLGFSVTGIRQPAIINIAFKNLEAIPEDIVSKTLNLKSEGKPNAIAYGGMNEYIQKQLIENPGVAKAYLPLTKQEYELVIPTGSKFEVMPTRYYTKIEGLRVPITELNLVPGLREYGILEEPIAKALSPEEYKIQPAINVPSLYFGSFAQNYQNTSFRSGLSEPLTATRVLIPTLSGERQQQSLFDLRTSAGYKINAIEQIAERSDSSVEGSYRTYSDIYNSPQYLRYSELIGSRSAVEESPFSSQESLSSSLGSSRSELRSSYPPTESYLSSILSSEIVINERRPPTILYGSSNEQPYKKKKSKIRMYLTKELMPVLTPIEELGGIRVEKDFFRAIGNGVIARLPGGPTNANRWIDVDYSQEIDGSKSTQQRVSDLTGETFFRTSTKAERAQGKPQIQRRQATSNDRVQEMVFGRRRKR